MITLEILMGIGQYTLPGSKPRMVLSFSLDRGSKVRRTCGKHRPYIRSLWQLYL